MEKRWNDITGKMRVFAKEYEGRMSYSTSLSNKKEDGTYDNMYVSVQFKKGNEPQIGEKGTEINVNNGFISFFKTKDDTSRIKVVIMEYTTDSANDEPQFVTISDDELKDLPF